MDGAHGANVRYDMSRRVARVLTAMAVLAAGIVALALPAAALGPNDTTTVTPTVILDRYGWWNKAQAAPSSVPVAGVATPAPATNNVPSPPTAPADGLYLVNDPEPTTVGGTSTANPNAGSAALGAVRYVVDEGSEGVLRLTISGTAPAAGSQILACPISGGWEQAQNGTWDRRPTYDCASAATGQFDADVVSFTLPAYLQTSPGIFDLAIVPSGGTPFQVGFRAPDTASIQITSDPVLEQAAAASSDSTTVDYGVTPDSTDPSLTAADLATTDTGSAFVASGDSSGSGLPVPAVAPTARRGIGVPARLASPLAKDATRGERIGAVGLLLAIALALWWLGGHPARRPRLLGSMGTDVVDIGAGPAVRIGGIGRFARPRTTDRPPPSSNPPTVLAFESQGAVAAPLTLENGVRRRVRSTLVALPRAPRSTPPTHSARLGNPDGARSDRVHDRVEWPRGAYGSRDHLPRGSIADRAKSRRPDSPTSRGRVAQPGG